MFINDLATQIGVLLPLLRSLREIQYWLPDSQDNLTSQFHLLLEGSRRIYPSETENEPIDNCQFNGNILDKLSGQTLQFAGRESILNILDDEEKLKP
ncbi:MAG TPA: hypothetical protein EYP59_05370 [Thiotrichaceae bacterium]|nr:hypothetical protein [Thiotrichaceae bacterium]